MMKDMKQKRLIRRGRSGTRYAAKAVATPSMRLPWTREPQRTAKDSKREIRSNAGQAPTIGGLEVRLNMHPDISELRSWRICLVVMSLRVTSAGPATGTPGHTSRWPMGERETDWIR
jgi:hypothetical protein